MRPFLKPETLKTMWNPEIKVGKDSDASWGLGWAVMEPKEEFAFCQKIRFFACHTGGAVGASSVLLIYPREDPKIAENCEKTPPHGIVVAIICNLQNVSLSQLAQEVAKIFDDMKTPPIVLRLRHC